MVIVLDEDLSLASFLIVLNKLDDEEEREREINGKHGGDKRQGGEERADDKSKHDDRNHSRVDFTEGIAIHARGRYEEKGGTKMGEKPSEGLNHR